MNQGGPVWHASAEVVFPIGLSWQRSAAVPATEIAWAMAERALRGVGDPQLLGSDQRIQEGTTVHLHRRLTDAERKAAGNLQLRDIRGTEEERERIEAVNLVARLTKMSRA